MFTGGFLYSASSDSSVKQWTAQGASTTFSYASTVLFVWGCVLDSLTTDGQYLYVARPGWDIIAYRLSLSGFKSAIPLSQLYSIPDYADESVICVHGGFLYSEAGSGVSSYIAQLDLNTGEIVARYYGHSGSILSMMVWNGTLFTGSTDSSIKKWQIGSGTLANISFLGYNGFNTSLYYKNPSIQISGIFAGFIYISGPYAYAYTSRSFAQYHITSSNLGIIRVAGI